MIMNTYDHFAFAEEMASTLAAIRHSDTNPRFFKANGDELFTSLDDQLSAVSGTILIAVDSGETETFVNGAEFLDDKSRYFILILRSTNDNDRDTVNEAVADCKVLVKAVRNVLLQRYQMFDAATKMFAVGPVGDNFYGMALEFLMSDCSNYFVNPDLFVEDGQAGY